MSISEKDAVLREQAAYLYGLKRGMLQKCENDNPYCAACKYEAESIYPLPKVTRPRVVTWKDGAKFKVEFGALLCKPSPDHGWFSDTFTRYEYEFMEHPELLRKLAGLIDSPTEEVDG